MFIKKNWIKLVLMFPILFMFTFFSSCDQYKKPEKPILDIEEESSNGGNVSSDKNTVNDKVDADTSSKSKKIDLNKVKPNELGEVMVLMYHNFGETEKDSWWRSFDNFRKDLNLLYETGYRLISLDDFIKNNISVPAGLTPVVFTFDDATLGQFSLIEEEGKLVVNPKSAVGIMLEFNKKHPEFGLEGTFYINEEAFAGSKGAEKERLQYLLDLGFDIGNHTFGHVNLGKADVPTIQSSIGKHVKKMKKYFPDYNHSTLALPYGSYANSTYDYIITGNFEDITYKHEAILLVGWKPSPPVGHKMFNPNKLMRVRASEGIQNDMYYYLDYFNNNPDKKYISDGDESTVYIPETKQDVMDKIQIKDKMIVIY